MSIWERLSHELVDIVEWLDNSQDTMVYRFERFQNEIKYGAKLVVRESQAAVFINEGTLADVYKPGTYTLETQNMPILATLKGWKYGFNSPFKAEVYFVNTKQFTDLKWGTLNPVMLRDPEFGPVRLRGYGAYAMRVVDPGMFIKQVAGTNSKFTVDGITDQLRNFIVSQFTDVLGEAKIPALDLAAKYDEISQFAVEKLKPRFSQYGLELTTFTVENISLPPEVEAAMDKRTSMGVIGDLNSYTKYQAAESMRASADNPGGVMGGGVGLGAGFAVAQQMTQAMGAGLTSSGAGVGAPPPLPATVSFHVAVDGKAAGPFGGPQLADLAKSGKLDQSTLVWKPGMANWAPAGQVVEMMAILNQGPPPISR